MNLLRACTQHDKYKTMRNEKSRYEQGWNKPQTPQFEIGQPNAQALIEGVEDIERPHNVEYP